MPAIASLEELKAVEQDLTALRNEQPAAYDAISKLLKNHRKVGYKNICKMLLGEATPEKLKGQSA
ncbi:MAG TPA: hypothetical protein ENN69_01080 [Spirochaetia bacterium]|nr:hypothetical protein [Spirochaetia bacterium]